MTTSSHPIDAPDSPHSGHGATGPAGRQIARARPGEVQPPNHRLLPFARARDRIKDDAALAALLTEWVQRTWPDEDVKQSFIASEVDNRLRSYRGWANFWRSLQISTWLLIAILGLLITIFAGLKTGHVFTLIAGAVVATLTTLTNAMHPSKQADGYLTARLALRDEGWDLVTCTGAYASGEKGDNAARFDLFKTNVREIVRTKRASTSLDSLAAS
jgi:hypothetical protein